MTYYLTPERRTPPLPLMQLLREAFAAALIFFCFYGFMLAT